MAMVTVADMANAREARFLRQREWLAAYRKPLVSFTMNVAGPVKTSPLIRAGFELGKSRILYQLSQSGADVLCEHTTHAPTGDELMLCVSSDARRLKQAMTRLEEADAIGRLWDIDVIDENGAKLERAAPRLCLLCGERAAVCGRARTHTAQELFGKTEALLREHFEREMTSRVAQTALRAVLFELLTTPKPGLVDRANNGAHTDMDCFTFAASAATLFPWFERCARAGAACTNEAELLSLLRAPGMEAERLMLQATDGVNTHKGAIFSLGILCAACGRLLARNEAATPDALCRACALLVGEPLEKELNALSDGAPQTAGQRLYRQSGVTGARGEAMRGFPTALGALPVLDGALEAGRSINDAGVETLLSIMLHAQDSNFIKRSSPKRREEWLERIKRMDEESAVRKAQKLDGLFIAENISPGGSADLLAVTFFMRDARELPPVPPYARP